VRFFLAICASPELLFEHLLHVADFALNLPARFFGRPSITQVWISRRLAGLFFRVAFASLNAPLILSFVLDFIRTKSRTINASVVILVCN
jgi:hypothetical protein